MFKKHEYTCPDVIHDRKRAKQSALVQLGLVATLIAGASIHGWWSERKEAQNLKNFDGETVQD